MKEEEDIYVKGEKTKRTAKKKKKMK